MATKHGQEAIRHKEIQSAKFKQRVRIAGIVVALVVAFLVLDHYVF